MITVSITEAVSNLPALLQRVQVGEEMAITQSGETIARVLPPQPLPDASKRIGFFKGNMWIADDFDEWPEEEARALGIID